MELNLKDKIIVISDGPRGIGECIVKLLAQEGAIPVIIGRNEKNNIKTADAINAAGIKCFRVAAELTHPDDCKESIHQIIKEFGKIDGLVNSTGINDSVGLEHGDYEKFITSLHQNLVHCYLLTHYALPALKKSKGAIVNISSKTAASNGGQNALTREWAVELLKYDLRVNAVVVAELNEITAEIPLKNKMTTLEEVANTVAFLLSEKSSHTTGQLIHVGGGYMHLDKTFTNA